ncbi:sigma-70 family RNA polymerase sigma factor [Streptomyces sp. SID8366]|uniref:helix-turn-helix transcriptional regulator n=1 Tax=unclassified Streptomyces TaxID=2593676 RepID=UPI000DB9C85C|nr:MULTISPECIES: LuxR C-terminal-related transcriptional regulator [unclassified Streptomyces]MYU06041.1 sigma-70 family RNA polymerase sigma factor [Streptomyces sp. SID8366]MYU67472.1 sigma-70 family RNA polymerase sigma factor [Streptomyces sp. SID69]RAJ64105.1 DNA-binding CsgD family transcriptional regulator [Streptomyces sp. PsTaAH-130]
MTPSLTGPASLTPAELRAATPLVHGMTKQAIARQIFLSVAGVATHLRSVRAKMGVPGCSLAVLVHTLLTAGAVPPPATSQLAPDYTPDECKTIRAIAEHTGSRNIGAAIGVRARDVRTEVDAVIVKADVDSAHQLVGLAHVWDILGDRAGDPRGASTTSVTGLL